MKPEVRQAAAVRLVRMEESPGPQSRMPANGRAQQVERPKAMESGTENIPPKSRPDLSPQATKSLLKSRWVTIETSSGIGRAGTGKGEKAG